MDRDGSRPTELFAYWRTSAAYRVRVALNLKGLEVPERFVDIDHGAQREPDFLAINPMAAVPSLAVEGADRPLTQSLAILEYLEEIAPEPALLPADPVGRARVRSIALGLAADTHPFITPRVRSFMTETYGLDAERWRDWQTHWLQTGLAALERRLATDGDTGWFCHGETVTLADICLCSVVVVVRVFGIRVEGVPTVDRIVARCEAMEPFRNADPYRQEGAPPPAVAPIAVQARRAW